MCSAIIIWYTDILELACANVNEYAELSELCMCGAGMNEYTEILELFMCGAGMSNHTEISELCIGCAGVGDHTEILELCMVMNASVMLRFRNSACVELT